MSYKPLVLLRFNNESYVVPPCISHSTEILFEICVTSSDLVLTACGAVSTVCVRGASLPSNNLVKTPICI